MPITPNPTTPNSFPTLTSNPTVARAAADDTPNGAAEMLDAREARLEAEGWQVDRATGAVEFVEESA